MSNMSRSARNRAAAKARGTRPMAAHPLPTNRPRATSLDPDIRRIGYPGRTHNNRVRYSGSGDAGYRSEWAMSQHYVNAVVVDARWSK